MTFAPITPQDIGTILLAIVAVYLAIRKTPIEIGKMKADTMQAGVGAGKTGAETIEIYAKATEVYALQVTALNQEIVTLRAALEECRQRMIRLQAWQNYAETLAHQLRSHRIIPEPFPIEGEELPAGTPIPTTPRKRRRGADHE